MFFNAMATTRRMKKKSQNYCIEIFYCVFRRFGQPQRVLVFISVSKRPNQLLSNVKKSKANFCTHYPKTKTNKKNLFPYEIPWQGVGARGACFLYFNFFFSSISISVLQRFVAIYLSMYHCNFIQNGDHCTRSQYPKQKFTHF